MNEWKVYYGNNFWGHERYARPGKEITVNCEFLWDREYFKLLSLYECSKGLVVDLCKRIESSTLHAFLKSWKERDPEKLSDQELEFLEAENPTSLHLEIELTADGKHLPNQGSCSMGWYPCDEEGACDAQAEDFLMHYKLDSNYAWIMVRTSFAWQSAKKPKLHHLEFLFSQQPVPVPGPHFILDQELPQAVCFTHPETGNTHTVEIHSRISKQVPEHTLSPLTKRFRYPRYYEELHYTLSPELREGSYFIRSFSPGDPPVSISCSESKDASSISIIGGVDGPTSIFIAGKCPSNEKMTHSAFSSLYFAPTEVREWTITFMVRKKEAYRLTLDMEKYL